MNDSYMTVIERKGRGTIDRQFHSSKLEAVEWLDLLANDTVSVEVYEIREVKYEDLCEVQE
jgi:hypothetical protein